MDRSCWLIPAHAGKTSPSPRETSRLQAHPRSRGENTRDADEEGFEWGSSPLTRGKLDDAERAGDHARLIPAHAGKTGAGPGGQSLRAAHPRSRGENLLACAYCNGYPGSSPLTRGKQIGIKRAANGDRLIPAHAGKTHETPTMKGSSGAHPRSRGENMASRTRSTSSAGSSPLTRGKRADEVLYSVARRLIPAHAGKTPSSE